MGKCSVHFCSSVVCELTDKHLSFALIFTLGIWRKLIQLGRYGPVGCCRRHSLCHFNITVATSFGAILFPISMYYRLLTPPQPCVYLSLAFFFLYYHSADCNFRRSPLRWALFLLLFIHYDRIEKILSLYVQHGKTVGRENLQQDLRWPIHFYRFHYHGN